MTALAATPAWQALAAHHARIKDAHLRTLFAEDRDRAKHFSAEGAGLFLDYSKNRITDETLFLLLRLTLTAFIDRTSPCLLVPCYHRSSGPACSRSL